MVTTNEDDRRYEGWRVATASSACVFVSFASLLVYTFGVFLKPLAEEFSWSREAVSAAFGIAAMTVALVSPLIGFLLDRIAPTRIIVPCMTVFGLAFASLAALTSHLWHLYAVFLVFGIVANGTAQMAYTRAVSSWFVRRRGTALAIVLSGGAVGAMVLPPIAGLLVEHVGWRTAALVLGAMVVIVGVPSAALFVRERPPNPNSQGCSPVISDGARVAEGLQSRVFWILVAVLFVSSIAQNAAITHMPALLTDRGVPASRAALAVSVMGGASLLGRLITGWLIDRFFAPRVSIVLLSTAAIGAFALATAHSFAAGALASLLIGFGMGAEADVTPYLLSRYFGLRSFAMLYGFTWTAYAMAGAIGPILMGRVFDATGSYEELLVILAAGTLVVALLMLLMPRYEHAPKRVIASPA
ncbi:MAG TPA: MFS transporter [Vicinamibacterales bacterium]